MSEKHILLVIGMHRSGTSLVAQWLHSMGLHLGEDLLKANFSNEKGHFEDNDFLQLHRAILKAHNLSPSGLDEDINLKIDTAERKKMEQLIIEKNNQRDQWGWKEPRTCLFLNEYRKIIPQAKYLIVYRRFDEVVDSLVKRDLKGLRKKREMKGVVKKVYYFLKYNIYSNFRISKKRVDYLKTNLDYYDKIIALLSLIEKEDYILCSLDHFHEKHEQIFNRLLNWGFQLTYVDFEKVFDKKILHKNINVYEYPPDLLRLINEREKKLNKFENI